MSESNTTAPSKPGRFDPFIAQLESVLKQSMLPRTPDPSPSGAIPAAANPAVARCVQAYNDAYEAVIQNPGQQNREAQRAGEFAYCQNFPLLVGRRNITDFIACVGHGMLCKVINYQDGTRILYAAQIAANNRNKQPSRKQKDTRESAKKRTESASLAPEKYAESPQNEYFTGETQPTHPLGRSFCALFMPNSAQDASLLSIMEAKNPAKTRLNSSYTSTKAHSELP
jgi:hypothetical protein